ncbi:acyl-[acyl-carrier-protein]-phospholipid O-acyltransferase / long-chain-fatty-acid--[acyl-carrier-protein] ligase [Methylophilaceae bacterium]|nr:acyl-[acyl-carrier-protein]-phospholipid O-acyltransferase / long-chain-fatty-acid--[acyl-carrier-protein] ligase [Methylophilaceae bacterium]
MITALLRLLCRLLFRLEVHGTENIARYGKLLIIANHQSFLDGMLIGLTLPFRATFVIHTTVLDNWFFRQCFRFIPHLAVDHTSALGIKKIVKLIDSGEPVVIFPEGRITNTGSLMKVFEGPGFVAAKTGATILPVCIHGAANSYFGRLSSDYPRRFLPKIRLTYQPPTRIELTGTHTSRERRHLAGEVMRRIMQNTLAASEHVSTLFTAFLDAIDLHGRKAIMVEDMKQVQDTYGDLLKKSLALGRLVAKVTQPDETVGVLMPNVSSTICLIYGMSAMRRTPALLNYTSGTQGMNNACVVAAIRTIVTSRQFLEAANLTETVAAIPDVNILYLEDLRSRFTLADKLWLIFYALRFPRCVQQSKNPDAPAVVMFTSGSEGKPKGVVLSHRAILSNVAQIRAVIDFSPHDKFFIALPLFHAFGFTAGAILPIVSGTRLFLYPSPLHYRIIPEIIYDRNCTVLFGTSTFLNNYAKYAHPYGFHKLRYVIAGAEKLNEEVRKFWMEKFGIRILQGYGATECAPVLSVNTPMANRPGTVGPLLPQLQHRLITVPGIARGGLLYVKGPNVMTGYYLYDKPGQLQPTASNIGPGWYNTGDVVDIDEDGFIHIIGRVKRFAKVAGEMVSLETVEMIASRASPEHQHAASAQSDSQRGENILLFTTDYALTRETLQTSAREMGFTEIAIARKIIIVAELPLLGTGKIDYVTLKNIAESAS